MSEMESASNDDDGKERQSSIIFYFVSFMCFFSVAIVHKMMTRSDVEYMTNAHTKISSPSLSILFSFSFYIIQLSLNHIRQMSKYQLHLEVCERHSPNEIKIIYQDTHTLSPFRSPGCTAILRCVIPTFVKEHVRVVSWVQEPALFIYPSLQGGTEHKLHQFLILSMLTCHLQIDSLFPFHATHFIIVVQMENIIYFRMEISSYTIQNIMIDSHHIAVEQCINSHGWW